MSHSDIQKLEVVGVDDDEEVGGGEVGGSGGGVHDNYEEEKKKKKKQRGFICTKNFRRAKHVFLSKLKQKPRQPHLSSSTVSGTSSSTKNCCFCFKKSLTLDSPVRSPCSDPNDPNFSYDMLKSLIENNDFYSKESNPHLHDYLS